MTRTVTTMIIIIIIIIVTVIAIAIWITIIITVIMAAFTRLFRSSESDKSTKDMALQSQQTTCLYEKWFGGWFFSEVDDKLSTDGHKNFATCNTNKKWQNRWIVAGLWFYQSW